MASEFTTQNRGPVTRVAPTTLKAQAWLSSHGPKSVKRRAEAIDEGAPTLPAELSQSLLADVNSQRLEPKLFDDSALSRGEFH